MTTRQKNGPATDLQDYPYAGPVLHPQPVAPRGYGQLPWPALRGYNPSPANSSSARRRLDILKLCCIQIMCARKHRRLAAHHGGMQPEFLVAIINVSITPCYVWWSEQPKTHSGFSRSANPRVRPGFSIGLCTADSSVFRGVANAGCRQNQRAAHDRIAEIA